MLRSSIVFLYLSVSVVPFLSSQERRFEKYKHSEAYQVHSGILAMPHYSSSGEVCEIVIQKDHFLKGVANLDSTIPHKDLLAAVDELAPGDERGPVIKRLGEEYISLSSGNSSTTSAEYQNVSVVIYSVNSPAGFAGDIVATIKWKNRTCQ
jgi:hypothetical protein